MMAKLMAAAVWVSLLLPVAIAAYPWVNPPESQVKQQYQETGINLSASELSQPHWLSIRSSHAREFRGQIQLNGRTIHRFSQNTQLNLSPHLTRGRQRLTITGKYHPNTTAVQVELRGPRTQVSQQTSGSGDLNQALIIEVQ